MGYPRFLMVSNTQEHLLFQLLLLTIGLTLVKELDVIMRNVVRLGISEIRDLVRPTKMDIINYFMFGPILQELQKILYQDN